MYFTNPWGLLALLAVPAILIIHLYHRRFPPLVVAGVHLWGADAEVFSPGRRRERLPITSTLLLELLAALLLGLLLGQPRFGDFDTAMHLVVVLDNSASMSAAPPGGRSLRDAVLDELDKRATALSRGSVVTVILTGRRPVMLAGPAIPYDVAKPLVAGWRPGDTKHDFHSSWDLAAQLAEDSGELLFFTDRVPAAEMLPKQMEVVSVGRKLENIAITAARWDLDTATNVGRLYLRIGNLGEKDAQVAVTGRTPTASVLNQSIAVPANSTVPLETELTGGLGRLTIDASSSSDALKVDSTVTLVEPKVRTLSVAVTLPEDNPARRFVERVFTNIPDLQTAPAANAQLIIGAADSLPPSRLDLWWLGIGPLARTPEAQQAAKDLIGPFLLEKQNPLLEGVVLGGVIWGGVQLVNLDVVPIITAGPAPLLSQLNGTQTTAYLLNIDLTRPNLAESPDWPILLKNLVDLRRDNLPGLRRWNYRLDEDIQFRLYEGSAASAEESEQELVLLHNGAKRPLARSSVVEVPPLTETGVYEIRDGEQPLGEFAVNFFDADESKLADLSPGLLAPRVAAETTGFIIDDRYSWIILLAIGVVLLAVIADWRVLKPAASRTKA